MRTTAALVLGALLAGCGGARREGPEFLSSESDYYVPDAEVGHLHRPHAVRRYAWPEHRRGRVLMMTNALGLRRDTETARVKRPGVLRVLLTGDSHTDGVVDNVESFATRLEGLLAVKRGQPVEVLNGGVGYYGPRHYARFLRRFSADLSPDALMICLYTGNDFLDAAAALEETAPLPREPAYLERLSRASEAFPAAVSQGLNQAFYFKTFPSMAGPAFEDVRQQLLEADRQGRVAGRRLFVVLLPSKLDVDAAGEAAALAVASDTLGLAGDEIALGQRLGSRLEAALREAAIPVLNLTAPMRAAGGGGLFWNEDHHLSVRGHELAAVEIYRAFGGALAGLPRRSS